jgi:hypothetical protein
MTLRGLCLIAALVAIGLAVTVFRPLPTPGPFARDFEAYYAAGAAWNAGGNPWSRDVWPIERRIEGVVATRDELLPYVGPAAALPLWSLLARLPFRAATAVWLAVLTVAFGVLIAASLRLTGRRVAHIETVAAGTFALASGPMLSDITLGQVALASAAALTLALATFSRHLLLAGAATFVAAIQPNLALPLAAALTQRRAVVAIAGAAAVFFALTLALGGGLPGLAQYLRDLGAHGEAERFITIQYTLPAVLAAFGISHAAALGAGTLTAAAVTLGAAVVALRLPARPQLAVAIAIALLPFALPFFHEHDFVLAIPAAMIILAHAPPGVRVLATVSTLAVLVDWFGMAQRPPAQAQIVVLALAVALALAAYTARETLRPPDLAPLLAAVVLALLAVPLARAFPAPTWPDMLSTSYRADPGASASAVWSEEQRLAGLGREVPAWGVLRAIPLAGCAGLALAGTLAGLRCRRS